MDARNGWQRFVDFIVPEQFREFFGGSPAEPTEQAMKILSEADILELERPLDGTVEAVSCLPSFGVFCVFLCVVSEVGCGLERVKFTR